MKTMKLKVGIHFASIGCLKKVFLSHKKDSLVLLKHGIFALFFEPWHTFLWDTLYLGLPIFIFLFALYSTFTFNFTILLIPILIPKFVALMDQKRQLIQ